MKPDTEETMPRSNETALEKTKEGNPEDRRKQRRFHLIEYDRFRVVSAEKTLFTVTDINSFGALVSRKIDAYGTPFSIGQKIGRLDIFYNEVQVGQSADAIVCHSRVQGDREYLGLMFAQSGPTATLDSNEKPIPERRSKRRITFLDKFLPYATCKHPFLYDHSLHFQVLDIHKEGARLSTSFRNNLFFLGSELKNLQVHFPTIGNASASAKIQYVSYSQRLDEIMIGVSFTEFSREFETALVGYLLNFSNTESHQIIPALKEAGLKVKQVKTHLDFSYVQTAQEYQEVLSLRQEAYSRAKKIDSDLPPDSMADFYDLNSRIIIGKHQGRVVGSVRMTFCLNPEDRFELDESIRLPKKIDRLKTLEISRLCVSHEFQSTNLVLGLIERATALAVQSGAQYIITSCVEDMLDYYKKLAFYSTGLVFELKTLHSLKHYLLLHDCRSHQYAYKMNPLFWEYSFKNVISHLSQFRFLNKSGLSWPKRAYGILLYGYFKLKMALAKNRRK